LRTDSDLRKIAEEMMQADSSIQIAIGNVTPKPVTGKITPKRYRCVSCGHESTLYTNHYGECYPRCCRCGWKHPMEIGQTHICLDPVPEGWEVPEPWTTVKLGDICSVS
jgi:hypothetical protein